MRNEIGKYKIQCKHITSSNKLRAARRKIREEQKARQGNLYTFAD